MKDITTPEPIYFVNSLVAEALGFSDGNVLINMMRSNKHLPCFTFNPDLPWKPRAGIAPQRQELERQGRKRKRAQKQKMMRVYANSVPYILAMLLRPTSLEKKGSISEFYLLTLLQKHHRIMELEGRLPRPQVALDTGKYIVIDDYRPKSERETGRNAQIET